MRGQLSKSVRYAENGYWPISNNPRENAVRPFVVGRAGHSPARLLASEPAPISTRWWRAAKATTSPVSISKLAFLAHSVCADYVSLLPCNTSINLW
ncbi:IS66 family transposase [Burkholderia lata]|uniref:IS66 family transposase n=1 Tax=Burkholderia lata (strain ATCC 17760 / DSM 23089 / LMG 22485 / NCIMB 9086 / R18194 / 383) TaxID=482957 RepID=UPI0020C6FEC5|nr:IS66 family transposase [Burkholderia lata]